MTHATTLPTKPGGKSMSHLLHWLILIPLALYSVSIIVLGLIVLFAPGENIQLDFLRTGYSLLALGLPIAMIVAVFMRQRWLIAILAVPLIIQLYHFIPIMMPKAPTAPANSTRIDVFTMNFLAHDPPEIRAGTELLASTDADIIMLQEFSIPAANFLKDNLSEEYPYQALDPQPGRFDFMRGQGVLSRYPILESEYWQYPDLPETHGNQRVVIEIEGQRVVLYNVHPWPPFFFGRGQLISFTEAYAVSNRDAIYDIIDRLETETDPVIVAGDFNTGDQFTRYDLFASRFSDSYRVAGQGMGYTYPACGVGPLPSLIRLDYVFYSQPFQAMDAQVIETCGISDHKAVMTTLALPDLAQ